MSGSEPDTKDVPVWEGKYAHLGARVHAVASNRGDVIFMAQDPAGEYDVCQECGSDGSRGLGISWDSIASLIEWLELVKRERISEGGPG